MTNPAYTLDLTSEQQQQFDRVTQQIADMVSAALAPEETAVFFFHNTHTSSTAWMGVCSAQGQWHKKYLERSEQGQPSALGAALNAIEQLVTDPRTYALSIQVVPATRQHEKQCQARLHIGLNPELFADDALMLIGHQLYAMPPLPPGDESTLQKAIKAEKIKTTVLYACYQNDMQRLEALLPQAKPTDLNKKFKLLGSPLHLACMHGNTDMLQRLVDAGADLEASNFLRYTPLLYALSLRDERSAQALIELGANVNHIGAQSSNALGIAINAGCSTQMLEILLQKGCDINHLAQDKRDLLAIAAAKGLLPVMRFLLAHGIRRDGLAKALYAAIWWGNSPAVADELRQQGADLHAALATDVSLLYRLVQWQRTDMVAYLLAQGVDFEAMPGKAVSRKIIASKIAHVPGLRSAGKIKLRS